MAWFVCLFGAALVVAQGLLSYRAGAFFNNGVINDKGHRFLCFSKHGAMYADLLILCPVLYFAAGHADQWSTSKITVFATLACMASAVMNFVIYPKLATPSCHYDENMEITAAGKLHFIFMALVIGVVALFYLGTPRVDNQTALLISLAITISLPCQTIVPDLVVKGRVDVLGSLQLLPMQAIIALGYANITELGWISF